MKNAQPVCNRVMRRNGAVEAPGPGPTSGLATSTDRAQVGRGMRSGAREEGRSLVVGVWLGGPLPLGGRMDVDAETGAGEDAAMGMGRDRWEVREDGARDRAPMLRLRVGARIAVRWRSIAPGSETGLGARAVRSEEPDARPVGPGIAQSTVRQEGKCRDWESGVCTTWLGWTQSTRRKRVGYRRRRGRHDVGGRSLPPGVRHIFRTKLPH